MHIGFGSFTGHIREFFWTQEFVTLDRVAQLKNMIKPYNEYVRAYFPFNIEHDTSDKFMGMGGFLDEQSTEGVQVVKLAGFNDIC